MKRIHLHFIGMFLLVCVSAWVVRADEIKQADVFTSGKDGYKVYRIPAIVVTRQGTLLAFAEGRKSGSDTGDIDMLVKRSADGGRTWAAHKVIWDDDKNTCGNPCAVVDRDTGAVHLLMTRNLGEDHESRIIRRTSKGTRTVWVCNSRDDGLSWSKPVEITETAKKPDWGWYATGPGAGIQIARGPHKGRLLIPCDHSTYPWTGYYSHVIYSDDHGETWQLGGSTPKNRVNECEVVELSEPAGRLILNMRNYDRSTPARQTALSDDGGLTWKDQRHDPVLIEPVCQASIRRHSWPEDGRPGVILFSNPASEKGRVKMTVRTSYDDGRTWPVSKQIYAGSGSYSCLVVLPDGHIGCLYEADGCDRIVFARFSLDWLTDGMPQK